MRAMTDKARISKDLRGESSPRRSSEEAESSMDGRLSRCRVVMLDALTGEEHSFRAPPPHSKDESSSHFREAEIDPDVSLRSLELYIQQHVVPSIPPLSPPEWRSVQSRGTCGPFVCLLEESGQSLRAAEKSLGSAFRSYSSKSLDDGASLVLVLLRPELLRCLAHDGTVSKRQSDGSGQRVKAERCACASTSHFYNFPTVLPHCHSVCGRSSWREEDFADKTLCLARLSEEDLKIVDAASLWRGKEPIDGFRRRIFVAANLLSETRQAEAASRELLLRVQTQRRSIKTLQLSLARQVEALETWMETLQLRLVTEMSENKKQLADAWSVLRSLKDTPADPLLLLMSGTRNNIAEELSSQKPRTAACAADLVDVVLIENFLKSAEEAGLKLSAALQQLQENAVATSSAVKEKISNLENLHLAEEALAWREGKGLGEKPSSVASLIAAVEDQLALTKLHAEAFEKLKVETPVAYCAAGSAVSRLETLVSRHCAAASRLSELSVCQKSLKRRLKERWKAVCQAQLEKLCGILRAKAGLQSLQSRGVFLREELKRQREALKKLESLRRLPHALASAASETARRVLFRGLFGLALRASRQAMERLYFEETKRRAVFLSEIAPWLPRETFAPLLQNPAPPPTLPTEPPSEPGLESLIDAEALATLLQRQLDEWAEKGWPLLSSRDDDTTEETKDSAKDCEMQKTERTHVELLLRGIKKGRVGINTQSSDKGHSTALVANSKTVQKSSAPLCSTAENEKDGEVPPREEKPLDPPIASNASPKSGRVALAERLFAAVFSERR